MNYDYSAALIMATDAEEFAVRSMYPNWTSVTFPEDAQEYFRAEFEREGKTFRIVYGRQNRMGMTAAASLSSKLIQHFRPRYLLMVGVAAGIAQDPVDEQVYGDVIVADVIWNYAYGTFVPASESDIKLGNLGFRPEPNSIRMDQSLRPYIEQAIDSPENQNHVHIGPMASGPSVTANAKILEKQIRSLYEGSAGLDMEAYAVAYAAKDAIEPRPKAVIIKGVCDYSSPQKTAQFQKYAAMNGAEFAKLLLEQYLPL